MESMRLIYGKKFVGGFFILERYGGMKRNGGLLFEGAILEGVRWVMWTLSLFSVNSFWRKRRIDTSTGRAVSTFYISSLGRRRADDVKPQKILESEGRISVCRDKFRHKEEQNNDINDTAKQISKRWKKTDLSFVYIPLWKLVGERKRKIRLKFVQKISPILSRLGKSGV